MKLLYKCTRECHFLRSHARGTIGFLYYDAFAVGIAHNVRPIQFVDRVNMRVPFGGGKDDGCDHVEDLHHCWTRENYHIQQLPTTWYQESDCVLMIQQNDC